MNNFPLPLLFLCCPLALLFVAQHVDAHVEDGGEGKCYRYVSDIIIAIDVSFSIREEQFKDQINLLNDLVDRYSTGQNYTRVGIISFASKVYIDTSLDQSKSQLKTAIGDIVQKKATTDIHQVIRHVRNQAFQPKNGGRHWATKKLILITDGYSDELDLTLFEASAAKSEGVEIFGVAFHWVKDDLDFALAKVVSEPNEKHLFVLDNYKSTNALSKMLSDATCEQCKNNTSADVVFVLDISNSIWIQDFEKMVDFVRNVTSTFSIGARAVRVGLMTYSEEVYEYIRLEDSQTKRRLKKILDKVKPMGGFDTNTHLVIKKARSRLSKARRNVPRIMVLLTDGVSSNTRKTKQEARLAHQEGIHIFAIGVGWTYDENELRSIASDPDDKYLLQVNNYDSLSSIKDLLVMRSCNVFTDRALRDSPIVSTDRAQMGSQKECKNNTSADVIFVLDSANSIWMPHFTKMVDFVRNVTSTFSIGARAVRVGLMAYSEEVYEYSRLGDSQTKRRLKKILDKVEPIRGFDTNTHLVIKKARIQLLSEARRNAPRIIVLLTDGMSSNTRKTKQEARLAHQEGIHIFVIGIGGTYDENELRSIASDPDDKYLLQVNNYDSLSSIKDLLVMRSCNGFIDRVQHRDSPIAKCPTRPNDVVFVYDAEWLSPRRNNFIVTTITDVIESDILNTEELRFGVIRDAFHRGKPHDIKLTDNWKLPDFKTKLDANSKRSHIDKLLVKARTHYFDDPSSASRTRTVVLFLDSEMKDWFPTKKQVHWLEKANVHIIVVGLGRHFDKLQASNLTGYKNLITVPLDHGEKRSLYVVREIIDRLCSDVVM